MRSIIHRNNGLIQVIRRQENGATPGPLGVRRILPMTPETGKGCVERFAKRIGERRGIGYTFAVTRILLARHGETDWNAIRRVQGWTDIPLNLTGQAQAASLADRLAHTPLAAVYASDLSRAAQTAAPTAARHGLDVQPLPGLREKGFGDWEGLTQTELERDYPDLWRRYHVHRDLEALVPGGESWPEVQARIAAALQRVLTLHPGVDETVLLVGHGGSARVLILEALQAPLPTLLRLHLDNASLSRLDFKTVGDSRVVFLNDTSHLEGIGLEAIGP